MPDLTMIVEGQGDVLAFPALIGRIGAWVGEPIFTRQPIRCGGWTSILKPGGLERWVRLAATRPSCAKIVIVVDLDDGCPVECKAAVENRLSDLETELGVEIELCFCVREFEAWLLKVVDHLSQACPDYDWIESSAILNGCTIRNAKGRLRDCMKESYGEASDQIALAKCIPTSTLFARDRSFRKFVKAVSGLDYDLLAIL